MVSLPFMLIACGREIFYRAIFVIFFASIHMKGAKTYGGTDERNYGKETQYYL